HLRDSCAFVHQVRSMPCCCPCHLSRLAVLCQVFWRSKRKEFAGNQECTSTRVCFQLKHNGLHSGLIDLPEVSDLSQSGSGCVPPKGTEAGSFDIEQLHDL